MDIRRSSEDNKMVKICHPHHSREQARDATSRRKAIYPICRYTKIRSGSGLARRHPALSAGGALCTSG